MNPITISAIIQALDKVQVVGYDSMQRMLGVRNILVQVQQEMEKEAQAHADKDRDDQD